MKNVYLVYGYYTDIKERVMLRVYSSEKEANNFKERLMKWKEEGEEKLRYLHSTSVVKETVF